MSVSSVSLEMAVLSHHKPIIKVKSQVSKSVGARVAHRLAQINYSRLLITRTFKGNRKKFELSGVRVIGSSKKIAESKVKNSFFCTVNILITFNCRNVK